MKPIGRKQTRIVFLIVSIFCVLLTSCTPSTPSGDVRMDHGSDSFLSEPQDLSALDLPAGEKLRAVATTNIIADVISNVGQTEIELTTLIPTNVDPHAYEPTPGDLRTVSETHVVFINGLGLEEFLEEMLENSGADAPVVSLSAGIDPLEFGEGFQQFGVLEAQGEEHNAFDPHVWFDPTNVSLWTERVVQTLSVLDPENRSLYQGRANVYMEQLSALDDWIFGMVEQIPEVDRKFVTDHMVFGSFAARYGFEVVGAVIPVYSSAAETSAQEIAELETKVRELGVKVLFVGVIVNPAIVRAVVEDTGIDLVPLYTGSLSDPDGPAGSYIALMRYNVESIVSSLLD
jgi:ABC-type Zn uptake system ZnuABC Zn-binding protein ZnuA